MTPTSPASQPPLVRPPLSGQIGGGTVTSVITQGIGANNPVGTIDFILDLYGALYLRDKAPVFSTNNEITFSFDW